MSSYISVEFHIENENDYGHKISDFDNCSTEIDYHEDGVQKQVLRVGDTDLPLLIEALQLRLEDIKKQESRGSTIMGIEQFDYFFPQGDIGGLTEQQALEVIELAECLETGVQDRVRVALQALGLEEQYLQVEEEQ